MPYQPWPPDILTTDVRPRAAFFGSSLSSNLLREVRDWFQEMDDEYVAMHASDMDPEMAAKALYDMEDEDRVANILFHIDDADCASEILAWFIEFVDDADSDDILDLFQIQGLDVLRKADRDDCGPFLSSRFWVWLLEELGEEAWSDEDRNGEENRPTLGYSSSSGSSRENPWDAPRKMPRATESSDSE